MKSFFTNDKTLKFLLGVLVCVVVIFAGSLIFAGRNSELDKNNNTFANQNFKKAIVKVGQTEIIASVADSPISRNQGLSGVASMEQNEGKIFIFENEGFHEFWMKDMNFPLDIIFINKEGSIVDIFENIDPDTYPNSYKPSFLSLKVIEVNGGWVSSNRIKVGDTVMIKEFLE